MAAVRLQQAEVKPLSPRSANIQLKKKSMAQVEQKQQALEAAKMAEAAKKHAKDKEYAPEPPEWVIQPPVMKGALAEKYRVGRLLGKGGFAMVYEGQLRVSKYEKHCLALKVVRSRMSQKKMEEKFRTELQIHAKMRHPNIVEFHRAFTFQDSTFVVLEMCSNGSVMEMVKRRRCLTLPEVRRLTIQLCGAIKYMHTRNVLHRDLKMGNLFLDHEMNLKVGDFGLAAVLLSPDEIAGLYAYGKARRTTLCGTPNYIAPEILEKGKEGHDHKVDLWAIGVILFAMLAGQPPFQSSSQAEIYKRARNVDYAWPEEGKHNNDIPEEARDLVSQLLRVNAEDRPDPDQVVSHPFFSMHGGNAIPAKLEEDCRRDYPQFVDRTTKPRGDVIREGTELLHAKILARQCGVGRWPEDATTSPSVGVDMNISIYRECAAEEAAGMAPVVPVPKDLVYASKHSYLNWPSEPAKAQRPGFRELGPVVRNGVNSFQGAEVKLQEALVNTMRRAPPQSHAATLRASAAKPKSMRGRPNKAMNQVIEAVNAAPAIEESEEKATQRGLLNSLPVRPTAVAPIEPNGRSSPPDMDLRQPQSKKFPSRSDEAPLRRGAIKSARPLTVDEKIEATSPNPDERRADLAAKGRARIASNIQRELEGKMEERPRRTVKTRVGRANEDSSCPVCPSLIFGPEDIIETIPRSKPQHVLMQLRKLLDQLDNSLNGSVKQRSSAEMRRIQTKFNSREREGLPMVQKWTNFSRKYGVGWMLDDGTVGSLFKPDALMRTTSVVVSDCQAFFSRRRDPAFAEKHRFVPPKGSPIEFIEACPEHGLERSLVPTRNYQLKALPNGLPEGLSPQDDPYEYEKGFKLTVWRNLGDKLSGKHAEPHSSGRIQDHAEQDGQTSASLRKSTSTAFVRFFQRVHTITIFGFSDRSLQFNFPDHGKIVIAADGSWVEWCAIPAKKVHALKQGEKVVGVDLLDREVIGLPPDILLGREFDGRHFGDLAEINELREKLTFVKDTVATWIAAGGLGQRRADKEFPTWHGLTQCDTRQYWQTLGACGEDQVMMEMGSKSP